MICTYTMCYSNPVLQHSMKKVFWSFPSKDDHEQWSRLDMPVRRQVANIFSSNPVGFAREYQYNNKKCLNYILTNYVDIKYDNIWSEDFIKEKKAEFKKNSNYFRIVKQGSILVYLTFHIFTIFVILFMAIMKQSIISLGYVLCLMFRLRDAAKVLDQRQIQKEKYRDEL